MPGYYSIADCNVAEFEDLIDRTLDKGDVPHADRIEAGVPVYGAPETRASLGDPVSRKALMAEWARVLGRLSGVLILEGAVADSDAIIRATEIFEKIIAREKAAGAGAADHFAKAGANDRIWNALQKLCGADPQTFARYFASDPLSAVCEAWLGPGYQMTAQVNLVRPGGAAQEAHRDYHLGFQEAASAESFPVHVHALSPIMTLQGAVAHCDMPVESGPTRLLPFSQLYGPGYLAYRLPEFRDLFEARSIQVPLARGDAVFFNPALFHAAGANRSAGVERMANLLQVSSPFGRAMEAVDRTAMCRRLYPVLRKRLSDGSLSEAGARAVIGAAAEGYAFPTNLDTDPPIGGLAPETQAALILRSLDHGVSEVEFLARLDALTARRQA